MRLSQASKKREPARFHIPSAARKLGRILLDQQMWCWGRNVVRPEGNALLAYGFRRRPPPTSSAPIPVRRSGSGVSGSCRPRRRPAPSFSRAGGFSPRLVPEPEAFEEVWRAGQTPATLRPRSERDHVLARRLLKDALSWIVGYERWAQRTLGADYRELCVAAWHKESVPAPEMARCWERLARSLRAGGNFGEGG